jgi:hypothetical protein
LAVAVREPLANIAAEGRQRRESMKTSIAIGALALAAIAGSANAGLSLVDGTAASPLPGTSRVARAIGTFNNTSVGAGAARLEASGRTTIQGSMAGSSGWWGGSVTRSWELQWNNTARTITFRLFSASDWTGSAAMAMTQAPTFTAGNDLAGFDFGYQLASTTFQTRAQYSYTDIQFDSGSGFVPVPTAAGGIDVQGSLFTSNYHALSGPLGNFTLRGKSTFSGAVSTSSDFSKFYVDAYQAVPAPGAVAVLGLGGLLAARRRR